MPGLVRSLRAAPPVTAIVATLRALLYAQPLGSNIWIALAWCCGISLPAYGFAMRANKRIA